MRLEKTLCALAALGWLVAASPTGAVEPQPPSLGERVKLTYDFRPSKVTDAIRDRKALEMDEIWNLVKYEPGHYLPELRTLLRDPKQSPFFLFDGATLLLALSKDRADLEIAAAAIAHTDLADVDPTAYFVTVHGVVKQGINALPAVERMLDEPDFKAFIPAHSLTLGKDRCLLYLTLLLATPAVVDRLAARLETEKDPDTRKALVTSLAYALTDRSQAALTAYAKKATTPEAKALVTPFLKLQSKAALPPRKVTSTRKDFEAFLTRYVNRDPGDGGTDPETALKDAPYLVLHKDLEHLRALRKERAGRISDEALDEIDVLTGLMQFSWTSKD